MVTGMREDVQRLATPEGRSVGSRGHATARRYVLERVEQLGLEGYRDGAFELAYSEGEVKLANVLARLPGLRPDLPPVLIAAHYDTYGPMPGADDNASAVGIALAAVEPLRALRLERSVVFAFFDAEEPPHFLTPMMGSTYFYERQCREPIHCALVMDLVGHDTPVPGGPDLLFILGMESDPGLETVAKTCEPNVGIRTLAVPNRYIGDMSDHHVFRENRRPYLLLTCGQWEHYHLPTDTPEKLNYDKMAHIVDYLIAVTQAVAQRPLDGPFEGYDPTESELYFMRKNAGRLARQLNLKLDSREDMEALVHVMVTQFGLLTDR